MIVLTGSGAILPLLAERPEQRRPSLAESYAGGFGPIRLRSTVSRRMPHLGRQSNVRRASVLANAMLRSSERAAHGMAPAAGMTPHYRLLSSSCTPAYSCYSCIYRGATAARGVQMYDFRGTDVRFRGYRCTISGVWMYDGFPGNPQDFRRDFHNPARAVPNAGLDRFLGRREAGRGVTAAGEALVGAPGADQGPLSAGEAARERWRGLGSGAGSGPGIRDRSIESCREFGQGSA